MILRVMTSLFPHFAPINRIDVYYQSIQMDMLAVIVVSLYLKFCQESSFAIILKQQAKIISITTYFGTQDTSFPYTMY